MGDQGVQPQALQPKDVHVLHILDSLFIIGIVFDL